MTMEAQRIRRSIVHHHMQMENCHVSTNSTNSPHWGLYIYLYTQVIVANQANSNWLIDISLRK